VSLIVVPPRRQPAALRAATIRLRRALRDVRDRAGRWSWGWRGVAVAGMMGGDGIVMALVRHPETTHAEIAEVFSRRWPEMTVGDVEVASPNWEIAVEDAVELARIRRGVEPLRILVLPRRSSVHALNRELDGSSVTDSDAMPILL
jgi:hypothetical protein